jgi:hypothetical protein
MGHPGLDPETTLKFVQTFLYCIACILGGLGLLGFSAYVAFLCLEVFSPQPRSKGQLAKVPQPVGCPPVVEETFDRIAAEEAILAEAERLGEEAVQEPALRHDVDIRIMLVPVTEESEPAEP